MDFSTHCKGRGFTIAVLGPRPFLWSPIAGCPFSGICGEGSSRTQHPLQASGCVDERRSQVKDGRDIRIATF